MADVPGKFYRATKVRTGVAPSSAGSIEGEVLPPVNPPGSSLNSVGLTMPSAFTVSNSPLTSNGTIGVAGAGTVAQYIRGDGSLADFPESSGGGSSVSYYLNGSVDQGTIGGIAYKELSKVPILGAGTDFSINADGYIASFITDAGDPSLLEIPGGNWNFETYFSASSGGGTPTFYVELYKVSSGGTATLIASSSSAPELIAFGTNLTPYFSTLAVPTTTLALTDRLAVRYYVTHSGRTITLHTENNHLCQIVTTFTTGITALNGLTAQVQNFAVGTTGTDFNIASATATHTFNLPTASATNRGALSSADWSLFTQAYNDKINSAAVTGTTTKTLTLTQQDGGTITASWSDLNTDAVLSVFGRTGAVVAANGDYTTAQVTESGNLYFTNARSRQAISLTTSGTSGASTYDNSTGIFNIPNYGGALSAYLPLVGGTMTGNVNWAQTDRGITWGFNTDGASIKFYNIGDGDTNSRLEFATLDNNNEYFRWVHIPDGGSTYESMRLVPISSGNAELIVTGKIIKSGGTSSQFLKADGSVDSTTYVPVGRTITINGTTQDLSANRTFNVGTVTSVTASSPLVSSGGTTPNITIQQASGSQNGFLSSTDWTTFNNKQNALTNPVTGTGTSGQVAYFNGTTTITSESNLFWDATNDRLGIGTSSPQDPLHISTTGADKFIRIENSNSYTGIWMNDSGTNSGWLLISGYTNTLSPGDFAIREYGVQTSLVIKQTSGNLLVGTTTDTGEKLQVSGNIRTNSGYIQIRNSSNPSLYINNGSAQWQQFVNSSNNLVFSDAINNVLTLGYNGTASYFQGGNVGIGTSSPISRLHVAGDFRTVLTSGVGGDTLIAAINGVSNGYIINVDTSNNITHTWNTGLNVASLRISPSGNVGIANTNPLTKLHITQAVDSAYPTLGTGKGAVFIAGDTNLYGLYVGINTNDGNTYFQAMRNNSATAYNIVMQAAGGNVLIGTTTDAGYKLDVNGTGRITGVLTTNSGTNSTNGIQIISSLSSSLFTGGIEFIRTTVAGGSKVQPLRDAAIGGVGFSFLVTANNTAEVNATYTSALQILNTGAATFSNTLDTLGRVTITADAGNEQFNIRRASNTNAQLIAGVHSSGYAWMQSIEQNVAYRPLVLNRDGGNVLIGTQTDNGNRLRVNGTIFSDSSVTATSFFESSDATLKTLVEDAYQAKGIDSVVAKLYIKNGKHELGYFAQDLERILPSAVNKGTDGLLNLSYREVHTAKIAYLEEEIRQIKKRYEIN